MPPAGLPAALLNAYLVFPYTAARNDSLMSKWAISVKSPSSVFHFAHYKVLGLSLSLFPLSF